MYRKPPSNVSKPFRIKRFKQPHGLKRPPHRPHVHSEISAGLPTPHEQRHFTRLTPAEKRASLRALHAYMRGDSGGGVAHALGRIGHAYEHNPVARNPIIGRKGLLGGIEDLVRSVDPIAAEQAFSKHVRHPLRMDKGLNAGIVVGGPGGFRVPKSVDAAVESTVRRPRTRTEAERRLAEIDAAQAKIEKGIQGKYKSIDPREQAHRNKVNGLLAQGERALAKGERPPKGYAWAKRHGPQAKLSDLFNPLDEFLAKNPEHPVVKAYLKRAAEGERLREALNTQHFPGEEAPAEAQGHYGYVTEKAPRKAQHHEPIKPVRGVQEPLIPHEAPQDVVAKSLGSARRLAAEQKKLGSIERSKRVRRGQAAMEQAGGGRAGFEAAMREQRGELPKTTFNRLREGKLGTADVEKLIRLAQDHPELRFWEKQTVTKALLDAFEHGRTPRPHEIKLLQTVFGQDAAAAISKASLLTKAGRVAIDVSNIPRTLMASVDLSAPFRQGLVAGARHPNLFARNFKPMIKAFGSERAYQAILDDIHDRPSFPQMQEAGLKFTELGRDASQREEPFISHTAGRIPLVRGSARAYTGFLDKMRADMFDRQVELARKQGVNVEDRAQLKGIARLVNNATGRGDLGPVEHWAPAMNAFFFSPRLIGSRISMLNPLWYASLTPFARKQALISMIRLGSIAGGILGLGSYVGASKVGTDPRSADFAKLRIGNTRADVLGGFQQYIRVASQLATGKVISSTTGRTMTLGAGFGDMSRRDIALRFAEAKFSPPVSFVNDFFKGTQFDGQPFSIKKAILQRTVPLVAQDAYDLGKDTDSVQLALLGYSISAFGIGMQTYPSGVQKAQGDFQGKMHDLRKTLRVEGVKTLGARSPNLPPELSRQLKLHYTRYGAYKEAGLYKSDPDYQRKAYMIDLQLLKRQRSISTANYTKAMRWAQHASHDDLSSEREAITEDYFPVDFLNAAVKQLKNKGVKVTVPR